MNLFILICLIALCVWSCESSDKNLKKVAQGHMSKVEYQGHSYVIWGINMGGGCVHDPECKCLKKE